MRQPDEFGGFLKELVDGSDLEGVCAGVVLVPADDERLRQPPEDIVNFLRRYQERFGPEISDEDALVLEGRVLP